MVITWAQSGLSTADYGVLVHLTEVSGGRLRVLEPAKAVEWEKSRMSHHINRMAKRGPVVGEDCPTDGRVAFVVVAPAGREALAAAAPATSKQSATCSSTHSAPQNSPCPPRSPTASSNNWRLRLSKRRRVRRPRIAQRTSYVTSYATSPEPVLLHQAAI